MSSLIRFTENEVDLSSMDTPSYIEIASYLIIACGVGLIVVCILGCCTVTCVKRVKCCFFAYITIMIAIVILQCTAAGLAVSYYSSFKNHGQNHMTRTLNQEYVGPFERENPISNTWDTTQASFHCCGVMGQNDFKTLQRWDSSWSSEQATIPVSCCQLTKDEFVIDVSKITKKADIEEKLKDPTCPVTGHQSNFRGCFEAVLENILSIRKWLIGTSMALALLELITIIATGCLFPRMQDVRDEGRPLSNTGRNM
ncbi:tetraspanin-1-like isoform X2 [Gigantopelta aegis]|nr:tetraspanin-1-like isoform X2 [Gigantopelta aegis]